MVLCDIVYENGEEEEDVDPSRIFKAVQPARLKRREAVYAKRRTNGQWYAGTVAAVKPALMYKCKYLFAHTDEITGARIEEGTVVDVLEDDLDSPLKPMRYTDTEGALYRAINLAMFGRVDGESLRQPPRVLTSLQKTELRALCEAYPEDVWNALDPQIFRELDRSFLHTVRDAQTEKRRKNYIEVSELVFNTVKTVPVDVRRARRPQRSALALSACAAPARAHRVSRPSLPGCATGLRRERADAALPGVRVQR